MKKIKLLKNDLMIKSDMLFMFAFISRGLTEIIVSHTRLISDQIALHSV